MNDTLKPVLPGTLLEGRSATLGVMGGGQLGRMFVHAAQAMGYATAVLDPDPQSPAGLVSHHHIQTAYTDAAGLSRLAACCDAITTEFENVPADALRTLAGLRRVAPAASAVAIAQDRAAEKAHFGRCGVACAPYAEIHAAADVAAVPDDVLPGILKTARMGYDGKGQVRVQDRAELASAWDALGQVPCVLEKMLPLALECSVIVARGSDGAMVNFPVQRNLHREGILAVTEVFEGNVPPWPRKRWPVPAPWRRAWTMRACCAWSFLCWQMAAWWSMKSHPARTTAAITPRTLATNRSLMCRCAPWLVCP